MKHKVSDLEGALLDAAVAKAEGLAFGWLREHDDDGGRTFITRGDGPGIEGSALATYRWSPSRAWEHGGPIIERERITFELEDDDTFTATINSDHAGKDYVWPYMNGPTHLVAAMRAFCASRFGEEVELP